MKSSQIFGYTAPTNEPGEQFVRYAQAFMEGENIRLVIRNGEGVDNEISVPRGDAAQLATAMVTPDDRLNGTKPLVLYFGSDEDRDELIAAVHEIKPDMIARKL